MIRTIICESDPIVMAVRAADVAGVDLTEPLFVDYDDSAPDPVFIFTGVTPHTRKHIPADDVELGRGKRGKLVPK